MKQKQRSLRSIWAFAGPATALCAIPAIVFAAFVPDMPIAPSVTPLIGQFTPAKGDPRLMAAYARLSQEDRSAFRFTPVVTAAPATGRAMTVVVRTDGQVAASQPAVQAVAPVVKAEREASAAVKVAPIAYDLGRSIGYDRFAMPAITPSKRIDITALPRAKAPQGAATSSRESRFGARMKLDSDALPGSDPRLLDADRVQSVDLAGRYKITRNLDVTAGVRLARENDRLKPLTDDRQDSQAVYVGTQIRF